MEESLESEARKRKERLKALKEKRDEQKRSETEGAQAQPISTKPKLKFRNYNPQSEELKENKLEKAKPEKVEPHIEEHLEASKDSELGEVNLTNLAPRKVDWDLKRDIAKKLEKLERRTQKAIVEIIRDKLSTDGDNIDLASAVATVGREDNQRQYDSD